MEGATQRIVPMSNPRMSCCVRVLAEVLAPTPHKPTRGWDDPTIPLTQANYDISEEFWS